MPSELRSNKAAHVARLAHIPRAAAVNNAPEPAPDAPAAKAPAVEQESKMWKRLFLGEGEEVSSGDYQKFQEGLKARKVAAKVKAGEKPGCAIM